MKRQREAAAHPSAKSVSAARGAVARKLAFSLTNTVVESKRQQQDARQDNSQKHRWHTFVVSSQSG